MQVLPLFSFGTILTMITLILLKVINFETSFAKLKFLPSLSLVAMIMSFQTRFTTHIVIFCHDIQKQLLIPNNDTWHNVHVSNYAYSQSVYTKTHTTYKSIYYKLLLTIITKIQTVITIGQQNIMFTSHTKQCPESHDSSGIKSSNDLLLIIDLNGYFPFKLYFGKRVLSSSNCRAFSNNSGCSTFKI